MFSFQESLVIFCVLMIVFVLPYIVCRFVIDSLLSAYKKDF